MNLLLYDSYIEFPVNEILLEVIRLEKAKSYQMDQNSNKKSL